MFRKLKKRLRKLYYRLSGKKSVSSKKKELPGQTRKHVASVMEKTGWSREKTLETLKEAKERLGISFADYDRNDFHTVPVAEQAAKYGKIVEKKEKKIDRAAAQKRARFVAAGAKKPAEPIDNALRPSPESFAKANERLRYKAEYKPEFHVLFNGPEDKQPQTIIAACYFLGIPLPEDATCAYQPSAFVRPIKGGLDDIRARLGEELVPDLELVAKAYKNFRSQYRRTALLEHTETDLAIYFTDWMLFCRDFGYGVADYFEYDLYNKEPEVRATFMSNGYRSYVKKVCNTDTMLFMNKGRFNSYFAPYINRKWIDITNCTREQFDEFIAGRERFFAKPITGTGGAGACIVETASMEPDKLYEYCREQGFIMEDVVRQHPIMAAFNKDTVNTLRLYTLVDADDTPIITAALAGACIGFLPYNFNPARIFMGETGASFIGFVLAAVSVTGLFKMYTVVSVAVPFLILGLPIFEIVFSALRRILKGQSPVRADKKHIHHRLLAMGLSSAGEQIESLRALFPLEESYELHRYEIQHVEQEL